MRAQVVLLDGERILVARHDSPDRSYWVLPGGAIESGESPEEAAVREALEETGLEIRVERLLFIDEPRAAGSVRITSPRYTYLASVTGGELCCQGETAGNPGNGALTACDWLPFDFSEYDAGTRDTMQRVQNALRGQAASDA